MKLRSLIKEVLSESLRDKDEPKADASLDDYLRYFTWHLQDAQKTIEECYVEEVRGHLMQIIMEERGVSEKSFSQVDEIIEESKKIMMKEAAKAIVDECLMEEQRAKLAAERIYSKIEYIDMLNEGKSEKTERQKLRDNQVKLTDEERAEVITKGAVWTDGTPGIWKSVDKNGNVQYCSNTHRAMAVSTTLAAAIKKFPEIEASA